MKPLLALVAFLSFSALAWGDGPVPECRTRPEFFSHGKPLPSVLSLPHMLFVGQRAIYYIENRDKGIRLWGEQNFIKAEEKIVCGSMTGSEGKSFSVYAPTLIDLRGDKSIGDSYWQFHMTADTKHFGIWNKMSLLYSKIKDLETGLSKVGAQVQVIQISRDEYELQFTQESDKTLEILSIRFDAVPDVD